MNTCAPCPAAGNGVNIWTIKRAHSCRRQGLSEAQAEAVIEQETRNCGRVVTSREIARAVSKAYNRKWEPTLRSWPKEPAQPQANLERIEAIVSEGFGLADLWERSPIRLESDEPRTGMLLEALFPGDPLICYGKYNDKGGTDNNTRRLSLIAKPDLWELIVPSPMTAVWGRTQEGKLSQHTLEATGPRRFLVVECDFSIYARDGKTETHYAPLIRRLEVEGITVADMCSAVLLHLAAWAPMVLAVHSAGKSIHGWFYCAGHPEDTVKKFFRYAVSVGADPATWTRSQYVRMPDGTRSRKSAGLKQPPHNMPDGFDTPAGENRQRVYFFNPEPMEAR